MKVLLVSASVSEGLQRRLYEEYGLSTGFAIQKYYKLMQEGLKLNDVEIEALSIVPIPRGKAPFRRRRFAAEAEDGVSYRYVPYLRSGALYHSFVILYLMHKVFWWSIRNRKDAFVLCDILIPSVCIGTAFGAALAGKKRIAWVTDMPGISSTECVHYDEMNLIGKMQFKCIRAFSAFIFMTRETDAVLNPRHRPFFVLDGFAEAPTEGDAPRKRATRDILYAGGLSREYGIECLCKAFMRLKQDDVRLVLYGDGPLVPQIIEFSAVDDRIEYRGTALNAEIVRAEQEAALLVNPRFTGAEYTLYTFPSKNMEYMASGTALVTTRLAGIPEDHYDYIYTFDDESEEGYFLTLNGLLDKPRAALDEFGARARDFVLSTRSPKAQAGKILDLLHD